MRRRTWPDSPIPPHSRAHSSVGRDRARGRCALRNTEDRLRGIRPPYNEPSCDSAHLTAAMATLRILSTTDPNLQGKRFAIDRELSIGRDPDNNDLVINE